MRAARRFLTLLLTGTVLAAGCTPLAKDPWAGNHGGGGGRRPRGNLGGDWPELRPVRDGDGQQDMRLPPLKLKRRRRPDRPIVVLPRVPSYVGAALPPVPTVPSPSGSPRRQRSAPALMP